MFMQLYKISHLHAKFLYNYSYLWIREKKIRFRTSLVARGKITQVALFLETTQMVVSMC